MRIRSPLSNLAEVIGEIQRAAQEHEKTLKKNEAATRAVLIDPLLSALGWDTSNTHMVEVERTLTGAKLDYALYDANGTIRIIVEAKALSKDLASKQTLMSVVKYAFGVGIKDVYLTDGIRWHHFTEYKPGELDPKCEIDLAFGDPIVHAAYFVEHMDAAKFWPYQQSIDTLAQQVNELESTVATLATELAKLRAASASSAQPDAMLGNNKGDLFTKADSPKTYSFLALADLKDNTGTRPVALRLPDGTEFQVKTWKDVLRECCKFALGSNPNIPIPLLDYNGGKVNLLASIQPAKGVSYVKQEYNGSPVYIYVNYDANHAVLNAQHVLKQVPKPLLTVPAAVALAKPKETA